VSNVDGSPKFNFRTAYLSLQALSGEALPSVLPQPMIFGPTNF